MDTLYIYTRVSTMSQSDKGFSLDAQKKIGIDKFEDKLDFSKKIRGLDYGCGIGRSTILMREFG